MGTVERKNTLRSSGFTLIEMLVVIVIMVILMGVVFRLARGAMNKSDAAKEEALVTKVRTLIEDFHAEYGIYPPVPVYATHAPACSSDDCKKANNGKCPGKYQQPINFRGACPDATENTPELRYYPKNYSYAKIDNDDCYFVFGLFSFFVDRSKYVLKGKNTRKRAFDVNGINGIKEFRSQWCAFNDAPEGTAENVKISISQKEKAFAHRVWPVVSDLSGEGGGFDDPNLHQTYDVENGYCRGFSTQVYGHWSDGIGFVYSGDKQIPVYDEGLVYISKPPYTTYLLFSKGPDDDFDHAYPEDRTRPKNKDNIYGNLGDK